MRTAIYKIRHDVIHNLAFGVKKILTLMNVITPLVTASTVYFGGGKGNSIHYIRENFGHPIGACVLDLCRRQDRLLTNVRSSYILFYDASTFDSE